MVFLRQCAIVKTLQEALSQIHPLTPCPDIEQGWQFNSKNPSGPVRQLVRFASADDHCLILPCQEGFGPQLASQILQTVGDIPADFFDEQPIRIFKNFSAEASRFTQIIALGPHAHNRFEAANPELQAHTVEIFPSYDCEFTGDEEPSLMRTLRKYFVPTLSWSRAPQPRLLLLYRNTYTGARSPGQKRGLARLDKCLRELESLTEQDGSLMEVENISGDVIRLTRKLGGYQIEFLDTTLAHRQLETGHANAFVQNFLMTVAPL